MPTVIRGSDNIDTSNVATQTELDERTLTLGTAVTASGTSIDFTGIPSWAKRITVMLDGVSTNGSSNLLIQLGDSGGIETTGYLGGGSNTAVGTALYTTGFGTNLNNSSTSVLLGAIQITNINGNFWVASGSLARTDYAATGNTVGSKETSAPLDSIRITTVNGTDVFDAGTINIMYEG